MIDKQTNIDNPMNIKIKMTKNLYKKIDGYNRYQRWIELQLINNLKKFS